MAGTQQTSQGDAAAGPELRQPRLSTTNMI
jgi:hypothetical protein